MKHQKHAAITRPAYGNFGRNEWAIIGTPCGKIQQLASQLTETLSKKWEVAYVDADHQRSDLNSSQSAIGAGASLEYTDKISHHRFEWREQMDVYQYRPVFNNMDIVLVNGNHFKARHQIVVIDPKKEDSLNRKLDRLTDVQLILLTEGTTEPYGFLKEHLPAGKEIPVLQLSDVSGIADFLEGKVQQAIPPLYGLVLAGGKSQRMGRDKGLIDYHGIPQRQYAAGILDQICDKIFLSCRPDQLDEMAGNHSLLPDTFTGLGPMGAILSAFREQPDTAWLVVACDLPLLDKATLDYLIKNRNPSRVATTFRSPVNEFPEPLVTIWEPRSYPVLLQFLAQGYSCPRKALINSSVEVLEVPEANALKNVNTPEEVNEVRAQLK